MNRFKGISMIIIGSTFWGMTGPMMEWLLHTTPMSASFMLAIRLLLAGILILSILYVQKVRIFAIFRHAVWRNQLLLFSTFGMLGLQLSFVRTIEESNAVVATLLQFLAPIFIVLYVSLRHKARPPKGQMVGILGTLVGLFLLLTNGSFTSLLISNEALYWGLALGLAYAFYTLYPARLMKEWGVLMVVGWGMIMSGIYAAVLARIWSTEEWSLLLEPPVALMVLALAVLGSIAYILFLTSMNYISAVETSVLSSFEPLTAMVISVIWLQATLNFWQVMGIVCMLLFVAYLSVAGNGNQEVQEKIASASSS